MVIQRPGHLTELDKLLKNYPVVSIIGARQVGKTTLARMLSARRKGKVRHFDLEDPRDLIDDLKKGLRACERK